MNKILLVLGLFSLMGAVRNDGTMGDKVRSSLRDNDYIAHEWGTFSSLQGSNGVNQIGLHHGDEALPRFVHCPLGFSYSKCLSLYNPEEGSPLATTQRMETPVIYFYSKTERTVDVKVDFPNGVITEWFPKEITYSPLAGEVNDLKNGKIEWKAEIKTSNLEIPQVDAKDIWQAQRQVDSNYVTTSGENDKFIFYRGVGRFEVPFKTQSFANGNLKLENSSVENIPSILLLNFNGTKGAFKKLGALAAKSNLELTDYDLPNPDQGDLTDEYVAKVSKALFADLSSSGLYPQEAQAMVDTWKRSYFQTPGLRVLYVLPRSWADSIVPLQFNPAPNSLVRTFVGRVEIFTAKEEQTLLTNIRKAITDNVPAYSFNLKELGRFAEPKLYRVKSMVTAEKEVNYIKELIQYTFQP